MASKEAEVACSLCNLSFRLHIGQFDVGFEGISTRTVAVKVHLSPEGEAKLNAFGVRSNALLVDAIRGQWQRNDRQQIGSKRRARANTCSLGLI